MNEQDERTRFETWISSAPFGRNIERLPEKSSWPGSYQDLSVDLAWQAWREGVTQKQRESEERESDLRFQQKTSDY